MSAAKVLRDVGLDFDYEPREYPLLDSFRYEGTYFKMTPKGKTLLDKSNKIIQPIRYTPDFVCKKESWVIETKGWNKSNPDFWIRWKLFLSHLIASRGDDLPMVFVCKNTKEVEEAAETIKKNLQNGV